MASFNKVIIAGNLTRDPELRVTPQGTPVCQFGVAVNNKYKTAAGEQREEVTFLDCEAWGKTAENVSKYLGKGSSVLVEGRLKLESWEDRETKQKRSKLKIICELVQFLSAPGGNRQGQERDEDQTQERHTPPPSSQRSQAAPLKPKPPENLDEDVPF